jgi:hypothetical protein
VFKNSAEGGKPDLSDYIGFWKIQKKSMKFGKIWPKRTGDDGGTVEIWNTEIWPVLMINRPISPINRWFFSKIDVAISGWILPETERFLPKIGK